MSSEPSKSNAIIYVLMGLTLLADIVGCSMRNRPQASVELASEAAGNATETELQNATIDELLNTEACEHNRVTADSD
jgi:hypothetical protein